MSRYLYKIAFKKSDTRSLLVCGDETPIVKFQLKEKNFYSVHTPYLEDKKLKNIYSFSLKYQKNIRVIQKEGKSEVPVQLGHSRDSNS